MTGQEEGGRTQVRGMALVWLWDFDRLIGETGAKGRVKRR